MLLIETQTESDRDQFTPTPWQDRGRVLGTRVVMGDYEDDEEAEGPDFYDDNEDYDEDYDEDFDDEPSANEDLDDSATEDEENL